MPLLKRFHSELTYPLYPIEIDQNLVASWTFDDETAIDTGMRGNNGSIVGNPLRCSGINGIANAFSYPTSSDFINIPLGTLSNTFPATTGLTINAWAKISFVAANINYPLIGGNNNPILNTGYSSGGLYVLDGLSFSQPVFELFDGSTYKQAKNAASIGLTTNTWHLYTGVANPVSSLLSLYVDSILINTLSYSPGGVMLVTGAAWIGHSVFTNTPVSSAAPIDNVQIFNRVLSQGEISLIYKRGTSYPFNSELPASFVAPFNPLSTARAYKSNQSIQRSANW